jgi:peptide/nickel transport system permease protein
MTAQADGRSGALGAAPEKDTAIFIDGSRRGGVGTLWRFTCAKPLGAFGGFVVCVYLLLAIGGQWVAPYEYDEFNVSARLEGPSASHWFGTDEQGRDVLSRVIFGARTSVVIGFSAVALATVLATVLGMLSGYFGGWFDLAVQRLVDLNMAFPGLIFIMFMGAVFGTTTRPLVIALGILFSASATRLVRGQTLLVTSQPYVEAARAAGCSNSRIVARHILPNVLFVIIVSASVQIGTIILVETSLAFLGLGTPPPFPSWGRMLQDAQAQMRDHPYLAVFPGAAIALAVFSMNMLGDALRDWWDPRLRK